MSARSFIWDFRLSIVASVFLLASIIAALYPSRPDETRSSSTSERHAIPESADSPTFLSEPVWDAPRAHPARKRKRVLKVVAVRTLYYDISAYTPKCDKGWHRRKLFAGGNFMRGGRLYEEDKPYPQGPPDERGRRRSLQYMIESWKRFERVVALPPSLKRYHEERIEMADGTWDHKWIAHVEGYGFAMPRDRITEYERVDCLYYEDPRVAFKRGVHLKRITFYERFWTEE